MVRRPPQIREKETGAFYLFTAGLIHLSVRTAVTSWFLPNLMFQVGTSSC